MSIAEKLITIAENEPKVYKAGQIAMLKNSKYMHPTISGAVISVNDVSPIEHSLGVKLSSDTITDFSGIKVTRCGKNIFDADTVLPSLENPNLPYDVCKWIKQKDGSFLALNIGALERYKWFENTTGYGGQVSFSLATKANNGTGELNTLNIIFIYTDGSKESLNVRNDTDYTTYTFKTDAKKTLSYIYQSYNNNVSTYVKDIMIAYGTDTEYEPYITPYTVTANADGTVEGLTSLSPNMTLYTDNDGVIVNCQYYRDIDLYIDNLITDIALTGGE